MLHESNARIAKQLRRLADSIELSKHERTMKAETVGGKPLLASISVDPNLDLRVEFGPAGFALFIGDPDFVRTATLLVNERHEPHHP